MGSNPSKATLYAVDLVKQGVKPIEAAWIAGIHRDTLYRSKLYKQWVSEKKQEKK